MRITKILINILLIAFFAQNNTYSQNDKESKLKDKKEQKELKEPYFFWGGSLWFGFGSYTYVDVNLVFGSQITERLSLGLSGKYQYFKEKGSFTGNFQTFETNVYGGSVFSQFAVIKDFRNLVKVKGHSGIIAHVEYEFLNTEYNYIYFNDPNSNRDRYWLNNVLVGGGYFQQMGKKTKTYIVLLWNVTKTDDNPYEYPQLRIGFSISI
ncbi:MAG: hypothetical protein C0597_13455 [Marinilabiliales bacterium]|nr:MAG: hypothetical protein C0597_13455 [Marinilabiliales bacterium]